MELRLTIETTTKHEQKELHGRQENSINGNESCLKEGKQEKMSQ